MTSHLEANLRLLSRRQPEVAGRVARSRPSGSVSWLQARSGEPVPALFRSGRLRPLHSLVDPRAEAVRAVEGEARRGFVVALGLGGGYQLLPLIERAEVTGLLVVEPDIETARSLLEGCDFRRLLEDPRFELLAGPEEREIEETLLARYLPALSGGFRTLPLRARVDCDPERFAEAAGAISRAIDAVSRDFSTQAAFGARWMRNMIMNLEAAEREPAPLPGAEEALVVGAGPSLDRQMERLAAMRRNAVTIATDAALPRLRAGGLSPDVVLSIDCQHAGYLHFLGGFPPEALLAVDLASPPRVVRLAERRLFFASGHPFARYLSRRWRPFRDLDTSGGNVGHAAVSLALAMGARRVTLFGIDLSYPEGRPYARESFVFPHLSRSSLRIAPLEGSLLGLVLAHPVLTREQAGGAIRYGTDAFAAYRARFESAFQGGGARIEQAEGIGVRLALDLPAKPSRETRRLSASGRAGEVDALSWRQILARYEEGIDALSFDDGLDSLDEERRELALTLLPIAAALPPRASPRETLEGARSWARSLIGRRLSP